MNNVPNLRFSEFSGEWEHKYLNEIVERITRKNKGLISKLPLTISAQYGLVDQETFFNKTVASKNLEGYYMLKNGEFAYNKSYSNGYPWGAIKRLDKYECGVLSSLYICFKPYSGMHSDFLTNYFETTKWHKEVSMIAVEGARNHGLLNIAVNDFFKTLHYVPNIEEQEKIGSFLSLIDKKIELQTEKVEDLKNYKKGIMQKIFSQELRFKYENGNDYPEWEEHTLGKLIKVKSIRNKDNKVELVLSVSNTKGFITQAEQFEDRVVASSDISNYKIVEKDDFAFNPARINVGSIARLKTHEKGIISPMYVCFNCLNLLDSIYFEYFLMTHSFDVQMKKKLEGSVRKTLSAEALSEIKIKLPTLLEQKKIGEFLNKISAKIEKEEVKLVQLEKYKKGLLQQMFI